MIHSRVVVIVERLKKPYARRAARMIDEKPMPRLAF